MNLKEVVPFLAIASMDRSLTFYVDGLGFEVVEEWRPKGDELVWCTVRRDGCALMMQTDANGGKESAVPRGEGVTLCVFCEDAVALPHRLREPDRRAGGDDAVRGRELRPRRA